MSVDFCYEHFKIERDVQSLSKCIEDTQKDADHQKFDSIDLDMNVLAEPGYHTTKDYQYLLG